MNKIITVTILLLITFFNLNSQNLSIPDTVTFNHLTVAERYDEQVLASKVSKMFINTNFEIDWLNSTVTISNNDHAFSYPVEIGKSIYCSTCNSSVVYLHGSSVTFELYITNSKLQKIKLLTLEKTFTYSNKL